jgi:hypothetical protein
MRAILTAEYPHSLLSKIIGRFRADGEVTYLVRRSSSPFFPSCPLANHLRGQRVSRSSNTNVGLSTGPALCRLGKSPEDACRHQRNHQGPFLWRGVRNARSCFRTHPNGTAPNRKGRVRILSDRRMGEILETARIFRAHGPRRQALFALAITTSAMPLGKNSDDPSNSPKHKGEHQ